jgi:hypothetical protein
MLHHEMFKIFLCQVTIFLFGDIYFQGALGKLHVLDLRQTFLHST